MILCRSYIHCLATICFEIGSFSTTISFRKIVISITFQAITSLNIEVTAIQILIVDITLHGFKVKVKVFRTTETCLLMVQIGIALRVQIAPYTCLSLPIEIETILN